MINPFARAAALVVSPRRTWSRIAIEDPVFGALLLGYVVPLAAIGPIATYLALRVIGVAVAPGRLYRASQRVALTNTAESFGFALTGAFLIAGIIVALAPLFGARRDFKRAFAIAAYAYTPLWLAAILLLDPRAARLQIVAVGDALVLLVLGLIALVGTPPKRALAFAAAIVVAAFACGYLADVVATIARG